MEEENSDNDNKVGAKRKALLAGMANEEYSSNADKTEPEKNTFVLSQDRKPLKHQAMSYTPRKANHSLTAYHELRTTHRFTTPHIPLPTPFVIPDERHKPRDLGSRPSHRPAVALLRIDGAAG